MPRAAICPGPDIKAFSDQPPRRIVVLGSTGSIGKSTLDLVDHLPDRFQPLGLAAHSSWVELFEQARRFRPRWVVLTDPQAVRDADRKSLPAGTELLTGQDGIRQLVTESDVEVVVSAIVGAAGLFGTWAALDAGKTVALANKETLVMAGRQVTDLARKRGAAILPVDSEHSAIFQALAGAPPEAVARIVLTASGGPFRGRSRDELRNVTVADALRHPTWRMGPKITIDSATLMNKALEVIEARWLFDLASEQIDVIIHPESVVHSFVEFVDGSVLAQLSPPDMRLPIQYALSYPTRIAGPARRLAWQELRALHFEQPDRETFAALNLGFEVVRRGGTCGAVLNAANEAAVDRFLRGELDFLDIARVCEAALADHNFAAEPDLDDLLAADRWARLEVSRWKPLPHPIPTR